MKSVIFQLGDVDFDVSSRTLTRKDGRPEQLRNKSKEVLVFLLERPNQTVKKADILNSVWADVTVSDESLVQCIADIRRIIGAEARQIVETVPREGYRINPSVKRTKQTRRTQYGIFAATGVILLAVWAFWSNGVSPPEQSSIAKDVASPTTPSGTVNTQAYLEVLQGRVSSNHFSHSESLVAERHFRRAIELDPTYARAYAELGTLLAVRFENDWTVLAAADKEKSLFYAEKAVALDPDLWLGHYALGRLHSVFANLDEAVTHLEKAMSLQPENEDARAYLGIIKNLQGDSKGAIAILEPALRSHPNPPYWYYFGLGHARFNAKQFAEAEGALNTCLELAQNSPYCLRYLIAVYGETGNHAKAEKAGRLYASMGFDYSVTGILKLMTFHHVDDQRQLKNALRLAGVPD